MKFIALRDFLNNCGVKLEKPQHPRMVHRGATLDIGSADKLKDLSRDDQQLVAVLTLSRCIDAATPEAIAKVKAEIAIDAKREATHEQRNRAASQQALGAELARVLQNVAMASAH